MQATLALLAVQLLGLTLSALNGRTLPCFHPVNLYSDALAAPTFLLPPFALPHLTYYSCTAVRVEYSTLLFNHAMPSCSYHKLMQF